jgi:sorbitol-specific phosphotransferase system component IIBC
LEILFTQPDFWLWFYLTFTISSTMMPSPADRKAWLPFLALIAASIGLILLLGVGPWIMSHFGIFITSALEAITVVFGITILIHLVLLPPMWVIRKIISRMVGYQVV